eukprot:gene11079-3785_t
MPSKPSTKIITEYAPTDQVSTPKFTEMQSQIYSPSENWNNSTDREMYLPPMKFIDASSTKIKKSAKTKKNELQKNIEFQLKKLKEDTLLESKIVIESSSFQYKLQDTIKPVKKQRNMVNKMSALPSFQEVLETLKCRRLEDESVKLKNYFSE